MYQYLIPIQNLTRYKNQIPFPLPIYSAFIASLGWPHKWIYIKKYFLTYKESCQFTLNCYIYRLQLSQAHLESLLDVDCFLGRGLKVGYVVLRVTPLLGPLCAHLGGNLLISFNWYGQIMFLTEKICSTGKDRTAKHASWYALIL